MGSDIRSSVSKNFSLPTAFISAMSSVILTYFRMTLNLGGLATSPLTLVEFRCLLACRRRARQIDPPLERLALAEFDRDVQARTWRIQLDAISLFNEARQLIDLIPELPLRALDALHLAHARHYGATSFATADKNQAEAARALGIPVFTFY
ncbi:MAG: type II toxin-antitoxin system VapC family toxin [Xanthomonadaceae bacterium]|nr:type II toxin-antitoxin system VapC family toxin [Xanthomonadaceae bacterium]